MKAKITSANGSRMIEIDGKPYIPAMYRSFRPTPSNVALFHRVGVRLYQMLVSGRNSSVGLPYSNYGEVWKGKDHYDFSAFDEQMHMFQRYAPEGYFLVMIQLDMPKWWMDAHPGVADSYENLGEAEMCPEWIDDASQYLRAFLTYAEAKYGDCIFGYSCSAGMATEWFDEGRFRGASAEKEHAYQKWLGNPGACVPSPQEVRDASGDVFREPDSNVVRYMNFCSELAPALICHFAAEAQSILHHEKIFGLFFGYTDCPSGENDWQNRTATNGYERVWRCPDIDMLFSPAAYGECRELKGASSYQYLVDSIAVNGKLYLHEIDHRTHLATYPLDNFVRMKGYDTEFETIMGLRRELCAAASKDGALWWFDFFGNYYATPEMEAELVHQMDILALLTAHPHKSVSEIAVFADPMSFHLLKEQTGLPVEYVRFNRNSLHECGAPYDYFNLSDLSRVDLSAYKMLVFLNAFAISSELCAILKQTKAMKVWIHAPGIASNGHLDDESIEKTVNMHLARTEGGTIDFCGTRFGFHKTVSPMYCVTDKRAQVLAHYTESNEAAVAQLDDNVYIGAGNVPWQLWRSLAKRAGVHLYTEADGVIYADNRFIAYQPREGGPQSISLSGEKNIQELFEGIPCETIGGELRFTAQADHMYLFVEGNAK